MTTQLVNSLSRELLIDGVPHRVTLSTTSITLTRKGRRTGVEIAWDQLLQPSEAPEPGVAASSAMPRTSQSILTDVARDIRAAADALGAADAKLTQHGALSADAMARLALGELPNGVAQAVDWFVEPLLTRNDVAAIFRISTRAVRRLPLRLMLVAGEERYRQSDVRQYLRELADPSRHPRRR